MRKEALVWCVGGEEQESDALLLLVSGLSLGDPNADPLATDLLADYITGNLGGSRPPACLPSCMQRIAWPLLS